MKAAVDILVGGGQYDGGCQVCMGAWQRSDTGSIGQHWSHTRPPLATHCHELLATEHQGDNERYVSYPIMTSIYIDIQPFSNVKGGLVC